MRSASVFGLVICLVMPAFAQAQHTDHALISAYEGSTIRRKDVKEFDEYNAFAGMDESGKEAKTIHLEGKVTKIMYTKPKERSILEIFRNYEAAIGNAGAEILFSCNQEARECAESYAGPVIQKASSIQVISNTTGRYLLARVEQDENTAYVAIAVGASYSEIHVVEVQKMDVGMVTLNADALGEGLDARGYVIVEGIYFDTDKATLQPQSAPAIGEAPAESCRTTGVCRRPHGFAGIVSAQPDVVAKSRDCRGRRIGIKPQHRPEQDVGSRRRSSRATSQQQ